MDFPLKCPHCGSRAQVDEAKHYHNRQKTELNLGAPELSAPQDQRSYFLDTDAYECPACHLSWVNFNIRTAFYEPTGTSGKQVFRRLVKGWQLVPTPKPRVRVWPDSVPRAVRDDYTEACLIVELSPKATAALARRCLQAMIRDRYQISMPTLNNEIQALKQKVDEVTWNAIDALRKIGNVGAHPEDDPDIIVDIARADAQALLQFVEKLIEDWYVKRKEKEALPKQIVELAAEINRLKLQGGGSTGGTG